MKIDNNMLFTYAITKFKKHIHVKPFKNFIKNWNKLEKKNN